MKVLSKTFLCLYLLILVWLVLCKTSLDLSAVLDVRIRSLNLVPFGGLTGSDWRGVADNVVVFIPFGLLLSVNVKQMSFWRKLAVISVFSLAAEVLQFVLSIGVTDITDLLANTLGGLVGLTLYRLDSKHVERKKLDQCIMAVLAILLVLFLLLRFFVFRVRY